MDQSAGILYLVATPIGNLEDITLRALKILQDVDHVAAEDTRHSGQLLKHFQIESHLISYHAHNSAQRIPYLIELLQSGQSIALITDAGTPSISDPGCQLVQACHQSGLSVVPVPGPTAAITALIASGLPTDRFVFEGFLPTQTRERQARLVQLKTEPRTVILYEAPHRLSRTLADLAQVMEPDRQIVLARELTKRYEELWYGSLADAQVYVQHQSPKGEFTLVLAGYIPNPVELSDAEIVSHMQQLLNQGYSRSQASRELAQTSGRDRREIYQLSLQAQVDIPSL